MHFSGTRAPREGPYRQIFLIPLGPAIASTLTVTDANQSNGAWGPLTDLLCSVTTEVDIPSLTVRDVLHLVPGAVLNTRWRTNRDLPLRVNGRLLGYAEFDSAGETMAVRLTEFSWEQQV